MLVFLVDDEEAQRDVIVRVLKQKRHEIIQFAEAIGALSYLQSQPSPDVILLDFQLSNGPDGLALAKQARALCPVAALLMMSSYAEKEDIVEALRMDVDDFILRPITPPQLLRRISEAVTHRTRWVSSAAVNPLRALGALHLDMHNREATWYGQALRLTGTEFSLLVQLTARAGDIVNYAQLYAASTGDHIDPAAARTKLRSHISNLRQKLGQADLAGTPIKTVGKLGFKWQVGGETEADSPW